MAGIYRKTALEKLSSPEQLDKAIVIVSPSFWFALLGAAGIIVVALLWSIFGRLPENIKANGIFMNREGMSGIYSEVSGVVEEVEASRGQYVTKGEVLVRLSSDKENVKLSDLTERWENVAAVTLTSLNDVATDDNKALLDLKSQLYTVDSNLTSNDYMLEARQAELNTQRSRTAAAKAKFQDLEVKYYLTLLPVDTNQSSISFNENQTNLQSAKQYLESAKQSLLNLDAQNENTERRYEEAKKRLENAAEGTEEYAVLYNEYESAKRLWEDYEDAADEYKQSIGSWESVVAQVQSQYDTSKSELIGMTVYQESTQAWNAQASAAYQKALSDYNTELSTQRSLEDTVLQLQAQQAGEEANIRKQNSSLAAQFDATKNAALSQIDREIKDYGRQVLEHSICSTLDGTISEVMVSEGEVIQAGSAIARVSQGDAGDNVIVCYVPLESGRKVKEGMTASVYPSTANKQEYGHMTGTVTSVAEYATSRTEVQKQVGLDSIVDSFMKEGPVVEIMIELKKDESTASGYWWSSKKGAQAELSEGTIISSDIIIAQKPPITMLIPYLKEKLTVKRSGGSNG